MKNLGGGGVVGWGVEENKTMTTGSEKNTLNFKGNPGKGWENIF